MNKKILQKSALWILRKTKYEFRIKHDEFTIEVQPVGIGKDINRYDFVLKQRDPANLMIKPKCGRYMFAIRQVQTFTPAEMTRYNEPDRFIIRRDESTTVQCARNEQMDMIKRVMESARVEI